MTNYNAIILTFLIVILILYVIITFFEWFIHPEINIFSPLDDDRWTITTILWVAVIILIAGLISINLGVLIYSILTFKEIKWK